MKALGKGSIASFIRVGLLVAWYALWFGAVLLGIAIVGYAAGQILIANGVLDPDFFVPPESVRVSTGNGGGLTATVNDPPATSWQVVAPALLTGAVAIAGSLVIVWRLRKLFDSFTTGDPFRRENALHLRVIWITMVAVELARYALMGITTLLLFQFRDPNVESISIELDGERLSAWGSILVLIVLAEVFREGARLKEEQELTI